MIGYCYNCKQKVNGKKKLKLGSSALVFLGLPTLFFGGGGFLFGLFVWIAFAFLSDFRYGNVCPMCNSYIKMDEENAVIRQINKSKGFN